MTKASDFMITLRALPDRTDPSGTRRLRRGLKFLLRVCGLRCVSVKPSSEGNENQGDARDQTDVVDGVSG